MACGGKTTGVGPPAPTPPAPGSPSAPLSFGAASAIYPNLTEWPTFIASDGVDLFWIDFQGTVWSGPVTGGDPRPIASGACPEVPQFLWLDPDSVYFVQCQPPPMSAGGASIVSVPRLGGAPAVLIAVSDYLLAATAVEGTAYWLDSEVGDVLSDGGTTFARSVPLKGLANAITLGTISAPSPAAFLPAFIAESDGTLFVVAPASNAYGPWGGVLTPGGAWTPMNEGSAHCGPLLADSAGAYCVEDPPGAVGVLSADGQVTTTQNTSHAEVIALDATNLYWAAYPSETGSGNVATTPRGGGAVIVIAQAANIPTAMAVDDGAVYWSTQGQNTIWRAAKQ